MAEPSNVENLPSKVVEHTLNTRALQRIKLLALLRTCDIERDHTAAVDAITAVQGNWPRNFSICTRDGKDENGKDVRDESDDPMPFSVSASARTFLASFLADFFDGKIKRTVAADRFGGTKQEVIHPSGNDTIELFPLYQELKLLK